MRDKLRVLFFFLNKQFLVFLEVKLTVKINKQKLINKI